MDRKRFHGGLGVLSSRRGISRGRRPPPGLASGKLQSHGVTFKIEGMLQLYPSTSIELVAKKTINSFLNKKPHHLKPTYTNQQEALDLAYFLIHN